LKEPITREAALCTAVQELLFYRQHLEGCEIGCTDICTCGMSHAVEYARKALHMPSEEIAKELGARAAETARILNRLPQTQTFDQWLRDTALHIMWCGFVESAKHELHDALQHMPPEEKS